MWGCNLIIKTKKRNWISCFNVFDKCCVIHVFGMRFHFDFRLNDSILIHLIFYKLSDMSLFVIKH